MQIVALIVYYVMLFLLGSTPRSIYQIKFGSRGVQWGTLFPDVTLLVVIGWSFPLGLKTRQELNWFEAFGYSVISPIMNGLACASFFGLYMVYKYLFLWQLDEPASNDTGGLFYPKALQHVFVGLYINQVRQVQHAEMIPELTVF